MSDNNEFKDGVFGDNPNQDASPKKSPKSKIRQ